MRAWKLIGVFVVCLIVGFAAVTYAQGATQAAAQQLTDLPDHAKDNIIWALGASYVLNWLKHKAWFTWLTPQTSARIQAAWGFGAAFLVASGVHFSATGTILDGGVATYTLSGVSLNAMRDVLITWIAQQGWYDGLVSRGSQEPARQAPPPVNPLAPKP